MNVAAGSSDPTPPARASTSSSPPTSPAPGEAPAGEEISYAEALAELEGILAELDADDVDVDHLAQRVGRAAELIRLCRGRVGAARLEIEAVLADLDDPTPT